MIYLFLFALLLVCIATATSWAGMRERREADANDLRERRDALMARVPSRERITSLMDRLPPCDEWLDDKYDEGHE